MTQLTLAEEGSILFGTQDENLRRDRAAFGVTVAARGSELRDRAASPTRVAAAERLLRASSSRPAREGLPLRARATCRPRSAWSRDDPATSLDRLLPPRRRCSPSVRRLVAPRSLNQQLYLQGDDRPRHRDLGRPGRHRQDLPRGGHGRGGAGGEAGRRHRPGPAGGRGGREARLPARRPGGEGQPLPAAAPRRAARHPRLREGRRG